MTSNTQTRSSSDIEEPRTGLHADDGTGLLGFVDDSARYEETLSSEGSATCGENNSRIQTREEEEEVVFDFAQTYKRKREGDNLVTLTIDQLDRAIECSIYPTLQERLGDVTKIFFDIEGYEQKTEEPSRQELWDVTRKAVDYVCKPFYQDEHFDRRLVAVATRHRWSVVCEKYKFSVRVYMPYSAARSSIPAIMTFFGLERSIPDTCLEIDMSVYKSGEQLLGCVGCGKPGAELCVLKKWKDGGLVEDLPTSAYLAQDVSDVLRHLDMPSQQASEAELKEVVPTQYDTSPEGDMLRRLVFMVDPKLADDRMTWIQMGLALRSAGDDKLEVWKEWSRQSRKYDEGCCEKEWSSFNPTRVTMGTVHYLAKKHSPEEYAAWLEEKKQSNFDRFEIHDDADAAKKLFILMKGDKYIRNMNSADRKEGAVLVIYNEQTGMWTKDVKLSVVKRAATAFKNQLYSVPNSKGLRTNYGGKSGNKTMMLKEFELLAPVEKDFVHTRYDSGIGKLLFSDCIYDMATGQTKPFDPNTFFVDRIDRPYNANPDPAKKAYVDKVLFRDPYTPTQIADGVPEYVKQCFASMLWGDYRLRQTFWLLGCTSTSKGTQTDAMKMSAGSYFGIFNATSLQEVSIKGDASKEKSWMIPITYKRGIFANEIKTSMKVDGTLFKSIFGGGDEHMVRSNNVDEFTIIPRCTPMFLANDMLQFNPCDDAVKDRINGIVDMTVRFVNQDDYATKADDDNYKLRDANLKSLFNQDEYKDALLSIILDAALVMHRQGGLKVPASVLQAKEDWLEDGMSFNSIFNQEFEVTGKDIDFVPSDVLLKHFKESEIVMSPQKLKKEMVKLQGVRATVKDKEWVAAYGRQMRGYFGVRRKDQFFGAPVEMAESPHDELDAPQPPVPPPAPARHNTPFF